MSKSKEWESCGEKEFIRTLFVYVESTVVGRNEVRHWGGGEEEEIDRQENREKEKREIERERERESYEVFVRWKHEIMETERERERERERARGRERLRGLYEREVYVCNVKFPIPNRNLGSETGVIYQFG